jgi:purine-nucleoside phosphorylase
MTPHIEAKKNEIAETVIMPGDPNRVKYITEKYLKNAKLVNKVRSNYAYTGYYKDKLVTIMSSGMGMPSMGIYSYELFKFYDVKNIIRIGSCGAIKEEIPLGTVILVKGAYTNSNFSYQLNKENINYCLSSKEINDKIKISSNNSNILEQDVKTSDVFYHQKQEQDNFSYIAVEMECFALFYIAKILKRNASAVLTVSDNIKTKEEMSSLERETTFDDAITLVLESL